MKSMFKSWNSHAVWTWFLLKNPRHFSVESYQNARIAFTHVYFFALIFAGSLRRYLNIRPATSCSNSFLGTWQMLMHEKLCDLYSWQWLEMCFHYLYNSILFWERGGSVVECRTPEREVGGSIPTAAVLCSWARHFTPRKYWLITQEAVAPSRHDWKIVDWDVKPQHKQNLFCFCLNLYCYMHYLLFESIAEDNW